MICALASGVQAQGKSKIIFDEDTAGLGGTGTRSLLVLLQAPNVDLLGVTGDARRDEEAAHSPRVLELVGRTDITVVPGVAFPLFRTKEWTLEREKHYGSVRYLGARSQRPNNHRPFEVPTLREGNPTINATNEDSAQFLVRTVKAHPHQVTLYARGPLRNIALAISLDPQIAEITNGIVIKGTSIPPRTDSPEFATDPRDEVNVWFDPEATHIVLRAHWPSVQITTTGVSLETQFTQEMVDQLLKFSRRWRNTLPSMLIRDAARCGMNWPQHHGSIQA